MKQNSSQPPMKISNFKVIQLGLLVALSNCCLGYCGMCLSSIQTLLTNHNNLNEKQSIYHLSISTSSLNLGSLLGAFLYKKFLQKYSYRNSFLRIDILTIFFLLIQLIDLNIFYLTFGRFFFGIFQTIGLGITTQFLNKISKTLKPQLKGTLGSFSQLLFVFGVIVAYLVSYILPQQINQNQIWTQIQWRVYIGFPIFFSLLRIWAIYMKQEYIFIEKICKIQQKNTLQKDQRSQKQNSQRSKVIQKNSINQNNIKTLKQVNQKKSYRKRLIVACLVIASNQFSCINGIFFYAKQMMNLVTNNNEQFSKILMLFLAFGQFCAALISGRLLNKYGRRQIFIKGQKIIIIILLLCFFLDIQQPYITLNQRHFFIGVLINLHVIIFNLSLGPICMFYCSQIMNDLKYMIITLKCLSLFFALSSDYLIHLIGIGQMFLIFGLITLFVHIYLIFNMKQTMGLDRGQIYQLYAQKIEIKQQISEKKKHYKIQKIQQQEQPQVDSLNQQRIDLNNIDHYDEQKITLQENYKQHQSQKKQQQN